ncbi:HepT-like ribonuclease domain-containing protein [Gulosibacter molinativorax]|uniref:DUF86 domain-containing protein n=1 Tax=Gulosibacter molinativorax TaxID=256821 RepID=A0ABT7C8C5_9MICO|nr:HepT-like ribonuclease domain-containing protein [Gulosibacter molinativorax]MDJ1371434.1 DUF86 domain-containing protein [Gulosibacter molinativorax]QUY62932.1 Hypotetical protein [Gulosibacter molinativorax]
MRPDNNVAALLWDALDFARNVETAIGDTSLETYLDGGPKAWATERQIELIGDALGRLRKADPEFAMRIPNMDRIIGMRNVLVHGYLVVNDRIVWQAATKAVPELIPVLEGLLAEFGSPE